ncbi:MAG TPA: hypothetical protein VNY35_02945 [Solirubrobacteraceae bacterium]|jgi:hypothetical protein|nr:hypothetical protein [Solirubrobacteraceae bacterium]
MSELDGLVGIYGAIDQVARNDEESRAEVSRLLPLYRDPGLHWYDDFQTWLRGSRREVVDPGEPLFPQLEPALRELAKVDPRGRMQARRLFALAVAARAFPKMRKRRSKLGALAAGALRTGRLVDSEESAQALLELLADEETLPNLDGSGPQDLSAWWKHLIETAHSADLISDTTGLFPRPCSGRLVTVPGVAGPVAALKTEFVTEEIDFEAATRFIDPANWQRCMPHFWCDMTELGRGRLPGMHLYREVVSTDCASKVGARFEAETELEFNFQWIPETATVANAQAAVADYQLAYGRPALLDLICVDEGSLVVARLGPGPKRLLITTTKRIQFSFPFSSKAIASIMCALGYADVVGDLLYCAASNAGVPDAGTEFPAAPPTAPAPGAAPRCAGRTSPCSPCGGGPHIAGQLVQDMASVWARVLREGATAVGRGTRRSGTGTRT